MIDIDPIKNERFLLGTSIGMDASDRESFFNRVEESDFTIEDHKRIFKLLEWCHDNNVPIENQLAEEAAQKRIGYDLWCDMIAHSGIYKDYDYMLSNARKNRVKAEIERLGGILIKCEDAESGIKLMSEKINEFNTLLETDYMKSFSDAMNGWIDNLESGKETHIRYLPKWPNVAELTNSFCGGDIITIGARTSAGKTAFAINLAMDAADKNISSVFFTLEMNTEGLLQRVMAIRKVLPLHKFRNKLEPEHIEKIKNENDQIKHWNLWFDPMTFKVEQVVAKIKMLKRKYKISMVFIDYVQILKTNERLSGYESIKHIMRELKECAKSEDVIIFVVAQLNREGDQGEEPRMSQLREGGDIEQYADVVILLWREKCVVSNGAGEVREICNIKVEKNRQGRTGKTQLWFNGEHLIYG